VNFINAQGAQGETGSTLPNKASYTLHILNDKGQPIDTNQAASIQQGADFYVQLVGKDLRPNGKDTTVSPQTDLKRGIASAYTDILFDTGLATMVTNESQTISFGYDFSDPTNPPPKITLTLPSNASGISGTTGLITLAQKTDASSITSLDTAVTALNIQNALDKALFGGAKGGAGTKVTFNGIKFVVLFTGINNQDLPTMTGIDATNDSSNITIDENLSGDPTNVYAAVQFEPDGSGAPRYPNGYDGFSVIPGYGINELGGFEQGNLGNTSLPVFRVHMKAIASLASLPGSPSQVTTPFTPDPLGDGSQSTEEMVQPGHNTLVLGNDNIKDNIQTGFTVSDPNATATQFVAAGANHSNTTGAYVGQQVRI